MLTTNLLPPEEKKLLALNGTRRIIRFFGAQTIGVLIIGITLLAPSYFQLIFQERELERAAVAEDAAQKKLGIQDTFNAARETQQLITTTRMFAASPPRLSPLLEYFLDGTQPVTIANFSLRKDGSLDLSGFAPTRRDLLNFEAHLRDSGRFQDVMIPLGDFTEERNVSFTLQAKLKQP